MKMRSLRQLSAVVLTTTGLMILMAAVSTPDAALNYEGAGDRPDFFALASQPALAQRFRLNDAWQQVYDEMPELPMENQYINRQTGEVDTDNTLATRLIRYHLYIKGRPPNYRLDWKLTLADYLGANELMSEAIYPGSDLLQTNPMAGDIEAVRGLNRAERDELVQVLVNLFTETSEATANPSTPATTQPDPSSSPSPQPTSPLQRITPRPGDAQLLLP